VDLSPSNRINNKVYIIYGRPRHYSIYIITLLHTLVRYINDDRTDLELASPDK